MIRSSEKHWPPRHDLFGVRVSATHYDEAVERVFDAVSERQPAVVSMHSVHALITAAGDPDLRDAANAFDIVAPDGQPVRWALNLLHRAQLRQPVTGTELTLRLCRRAEADGVAIYLYGSTPEVLEALTENLRLRYPRLQIAGAVSPPFRPMTDEELQRDVDRINASGAGLVFLGLGYPKQDQFAAAQQDRIEPVQICVGAAFDFLSGSKRRAPGWMQRSGLEWFHRLLHEPRRLAGRYLVTNTTFLTKLAWAMVRRRREEQS